MNKYDLEDKKSTAILIALSIAVTHILIILGIIIASLIYLWR